MIPDGRRARLLALYLPQYHPIPENDAWWGPGFTEWTNVERARPLYQGHVQPRLPGELGFYDLRVAAVRAAQAALARDCGIEAFCYWHYWFAGRRLLERPFAEVLASGEPDFPFCLAWANQTWSGIWHGCPDRTLIEQTYPGDDDHRAHFEALRPAFEDPRYLRVDGRALFFVYRPTQLPAPRRFADLWRELAERHGLGGLFLVGQHDAGWDPTSNGFDARVPLELPKWPPPRAMPLLARIARRATRVVLATRPQAEGPAVFDYATVFKGAYDGPLPAHELPLVVPNWDNTPRCGRRGYVLANPTPAAFEGYLRRAIEQVINRPPERRLVIIRAWNEWAEGNYLEPDREFGRGYLEAVRAALAGVAPARSGNPATRLQAVRKAVLAIVPDSVASLLHEISRDFHAQRLARRTQRSNTRAVADLLARRGQPLKLELGSPRRPERPDWTFADMVADSDIQLDFVSPLPLPDDCVDVIYSSHLFEHFSYPQPMRRVFAECRRVLKPGGVFSIAVPDGRLYLDADAQPERDGRDGLRRSDTGTSSPPRIDPADYSSYIGGRHRHLFDEERLVALLSEAGFRDVRLREFEPGLDLERRRHETIYALGVK